MKHNGGQFFEQEPTESEQEYKLPGDEPIMLKAMNYVPNPPNYNKEDLGVKLPGVSLRYGYSKYYRRNK